jgi:hypothetical protein
MESCLKKLVLEARRQAFRTRKRAVASQWDIWEKIMCSEGSTGGRRVYTCNRRRAKKLIPAYTEMGYLPLVIVGRESSDAAAVCSDGATGGGSHHPSRIEPPVVAMKKSIPGKTPKEAVPEKSGSSSGDNGFRGLLEWRFGADDAPGEKKCARSDAHGYIF